MAEDDDDTFGDFSFAPNIPNNDDDEWGDFVQESKPPVSPAISPKSNSVSPPSTWVKPSGALPLSLFGFNEEEDDKIDVAEYAPSSENLSHIDLYKKTSNRRDPVSVENVSSKKILEAVVLDLDQNGMNGWKFGSNVETLSKSNSDMNGKIHELDGDFGTSYHHTSDEPGSDIGSRAESVFSENELKKKSNGLNVLDSSKSADISGWWNVEVNVEKIPSSNLDRNGHKEESNGHVSTSISEQTSTSESFDFANSYTQTSNRPDSYFHSGAYPVGIGNGYSFSSKKNMDKTNALADHTFDFFGVGNSEPSVNSLSTSTSYVNVQGGKLIGNVAKDDEYDDDDDDDGGWEFKDAFSEPSTPGDVNNKVDLRMNLASEGGAHASGTGSGSSHMHDLFGSFNGSIDLFATPNESIDLFATSDDIVNSSHEVELTNVQPKTSTPNGFVPDTNTKTVQDVEGRLDTRTGALSREYDEDFGEFTTAPAEAGPTEVENSTKLYTSKGALPLSIFGDGPNDDGSSDVQDNFLHLSAVDIRNNHPPTPVMSVNDLISSLYSQVEQSAFVDNVQNPTTNDINVSEEISKSSTVDDDDDDFGDNSWDFQGAYNVSSPYSNAESHLNISSKLTLNDCLDFYSKLREELCFVAKYHIKSLEESRSLASSDEDAIVEALDHQLQAFSKELEQLKEHTEKNSSQGHPSRAYHLNELAEVLLEPKFQKIESEYQISARLLLVDKDLMSTLELLRHANSMLKVLTIGTSEEHLAYISAWSDMLAACAQELKHGAMILNQALEKNVDSHLHSETKGCKFILAVGEIYRVVVVLGASAKLFKPWIMSCLQDSCKIFMLLEECHTLWSTSGLEETLSNLSVSIAPGAVSLLKSINHIHGLDTHILQDYLFTEKESLCWLSILPAGVAPGLKMVTWGEEQCFVTLANLWGNMISPNPPNSSRLYIS